MSSYLRQDYNLEKQYLSVEVLKENNKELNKKEFKKGKYNKINFINEGMDMTDKNIDLTDLTNINNINNITDLSELNELNGKSSPLFYYSDYTFYKRASSYDNDNNLILVSFKDHINHLDSTKKEDSLKSLIDFVKKEFNMDEVKLIEKEIPVNEPLTQEMFNYVSKYWSCYYTPSTSTKPINSTNKTNKVNSTNKVNTKEAEIKKMEIAKGVFEKLIHKYKNEKVESILYDFNKNVILMEASDLSDINPISHSIMNLIEKWSDSLVVGKDGKNNKGDNDENEKDKDDIDKGDYISSIIEKKTETNKDCNIDTKNNDGNKLLGKKREQCLQTYFTDFNYEEQYYCKDLVVFTINEPCLMCSMALVHSRISEVYYMNENLVDGGMGKVVNLNDYDNLNHTFLIYKYSI